MPDFADPARWRVLEKRQRFADSRLWQLQREYFSVRCEQAWREQEVPDYITTNPVIAHAYAEMVLAFFQDRQRLAPSVVPCVVPLYICELGGGSGRFAFHFLRALHQLCVANRVPLSAFCYVLTDFVQGNLDAWCSHPDLASWFADGVLDVALFDLIHDDTLHLQRRGLVLGAGNVVQPLVVIANYVLDSVPSDLFFVRNQGLHDCLVSLHVPVQAQADVASLLQQIKLGFTTRPLAQAPYAETILQQHVMTLLQSGQEGYLCYPVAAIRCFERLRRLSPAGALVLCADKGAVGTETLAGNAPPELEHHGSFSIDVNFHALATWCQLSGGIALLPSAKAKHIVLAALLLVTQAQEHEACHRSFASHIDRHGPDDFYSMTQFLRLQAETMTVDEILILMRFNRADTHQLWQVLPRLSALIPELTVVQAGEVKSMLASAWDACFHAGERRDIAFEMGSLLYGLDEYDEALEYFTHSVRQYGAHVGTLCNMAACHQQLGRFEAARHLLQTVLEFEPGNPAAAGLLNSLPENVSVGDDHCF